MNNILFLYQLTLNIIIDLPNDISFSLLAGSDHAQNSSQDSFPQKLI